ncbi:hypothetical protein RFI_16910 [Reticulomyxa filosa]|uniref:Protein kinase domain-containing protein n=1 Tax=Reticulomyxa filosa TaxID=46433 RepID=X6N3H8_RETFI|nr:hypothetical protein RFI_16910 [Reticulomyxa filosa]|eukprot:ETO20309.1 hypothetical protein RFI_16910 [Reticulomyxa filosa]
MITRGQYRFPRAYWDDVSAEAISCVKGLMSLNPEERLNYHTLSQHPFILKNVGLSELEKEEETLLQEQQQLLEGSCSNLLPQGVRFPYDVHAREKDNFIDMDEDNSNNNSGDGDIFEEAVNVKLTTQTKQRQQEKLLEILKEKEEKKGENEKRKEDRNADKNEHSLYPIRKQVMKI